MASRMQTTGEPNTIHVTSEFQRLVANDFVFDMQPETNIKGIGKRCTYYLRAKV